jgi:hypothetical protein
MLLVFAVLDGLKTYNYRYHNKLQIKPSNTAKTSSIQIYIKQTTQPTTIKRRQTTRNEHHPANSKKQ